MVFKYPTFCVRAQKPPGVCYRVLAIFRFPVDAIEKNDARGFKDSPPSTLSAFPRPFTSPRRGSLSLSFSFTFPRFRPEKYLFGERSANDLINPWKAQSSVSVGLWAEQLRPRKENNYRYRAFLPIPLLHFTFNGRVGCAPKLPLSSSSSSLFLFLAVLRIFPTLPFSFPGADGKYQPDLTTRGDYIG